MTLLKGPGPLGEEAGHVSSFLRIGDKIVASPAGVVTARSRELAKEHEMEEGLDEVLGDQSFRALSKGDAGIIFADNVNMGIAIVSDDPEQRLPVDEEARIMTGTLVQEMFPNYLVTADTHGLARLSEAQRAIGKSPERR